jgi:hypothetical protein
VPARRADDLDGGGCVPRELAAVGPQAVRIVDRVEMTVRRLLTVSDIYLWTTRPVRVSSVRTSR